MYLILVGIIIVIVCMLLIIGNKLYDFAVNTKSGRDIFSEDNKNMTKEEIEEREKKNRHDYLKDNCNEVHIVSDDNLNLTGYEIKDDDNHKYAILVHGYKDSAVKMSKYAEKFHSFGFNVFAPDLRGHGKSEGNYVGMGCHDSNDILKWIQRIIENDKNAEIILFGISMGAATVMMVSGKKLPKNVKAIVEDCGYTSAWDQFAGQLKERYNLPKFPVLYAASFICKIRAGYSFKEASPINQVKKATVPMLFIHGDEDKFVPYYMHNLVYEAANCEKQKLVVHGAEHVKSVEVEPETYWNTISSFINKYM